MISFERKYCEKEYYLIFLFYFFRILAKFRNWGTKKKNAAATSGRTFFLEPQLSGSTHFILCGPSQVQKVPVVFLVDLMHLQVVLRTSSYVDLLKLRKYVRFFWWTFSSSEVTCCSSGGGLKLRNYVLFFWWTGPTTKWVCTRLVLYGPSLDSLVKKERASEAGTQ
jgi:hypothetical protein